MNPEVEKTNEKEVVAEKKKDKLITAPMIIVVVLYLTAAVGISWFLGMKDYEQKQEQKEAEIREEANKDKEKNPEELEEIKLAIDSTKAVDFSNNFDYILQNVFNNTNNHLVPDNLRNSSDIFNDEVTRFKIVYYIIERYGDSQYKKYNVNENGEEVTGLYAIKYDYFKTYYRELVGSDFNEVLLNKITNEYKLNGEYLYGTVISGPRSNYELETDRFIQSNNKHYYMVVVNEKDQNGNVVLTYKIKLTLSIVHDKYVINNITVY